MPLLQKGRKEGEGAVMFVIQNFMDTSNVQKTTDALFCSCVQRQPARTEHFDLIFPYFKIMVLGGTWVSVG